MPFTKSWGLVALFILTVTFTLSCSSSPGTQGNQGPPQAGSGSPVPTNGLVQSNSAGAVTLDVKWMGPSGGSLVFNVEMDTHSVELDQYDLGKLAILRDDGGKEYRPISWDSAPGGHHRGGTLAFPLPESLNQAKYLELLIRDVAGVKERVFKWEL